LFLWVGPGGDVTPFLPGGCTGKRGQIMLTLNLLPFFSAKHRVGLLKKVETVEFEIESYSYS
jgi:hypothetical protein